MVRESGIRLRPLMLATKEEDATWLAIGMGVYCVRNSSLESCSEVWQGGLVARHFCLAIF